ncbi:GAF domain-containing sensor histidine kinase [Solihabitans fulvus]|nr:GAF domain-containing protein [Solihabitans fulvus]
MRNVGSTGRASPLPDMMVALDREYTEILTLLDQDAAVRRMVSTVPDRTGLDIAWVGEPDGDDRIVLRNTVHATTDQLNGLVVPVGAGLGGRVLTAQRPLWVRDYCEAKSITHDFNTQVAAERIKSMIAVPIAHHGRLLGVLYAATRYEAFFGDRVAGMLESLAAGAATAQIVSERAKHLAEVAVHEERRRLALELHDTVGAMLFTLGAGIRTLGAQDGLDDTVRARLSAIERQAAEATAALRGSLRVLSAPPEQVALGVALREHCQAFRARTGLDARLLTLTELPTLHGSRISALADAAREALLNVEKHAHARSVVVSVFALRDGIAAAISDDGVGFACGDTGELRPGLGLTAVHERLARVGGTVTIGRNDDGGVTLQAWVPATEATA